MGGSTRQKQEELVNAESKFQQVFATRTKELKEELSKPIPHVSCDFTAYEGFFVRDKETFSLKTKSKNRDKQRQEFVRHVFHKFPVPKFMFNAWELPQAVRGYCNGIQMPSSGFATKEDYRLWYICIAEGGSFYKEYGQALFTKKECHEFLNCKHNITIDKAVVYAIAYTESKNLGKALRIAQSKISSLPLDNFWRGIVRFFSRQDIESKEIVDDIVDYIVYKRAENPTFTIIGKGHTINSLLKKVEKWHQDLRRLKLIGDSFWEGIPVKDYEYTYKNVDNTINVWKFTQIKSAKELQKEGNAMRHCVLSYKRDCIAGSCSIWSLTFNGTRKLTIEIRNGYICQVRGLANRLARPDEQNILKKWAIDFRFYYRR